MAAQILGNKKVLSAALTGWDVTAERRNCAERSFNESLQCLMSSEEADSLLQQHKRLKALQCNNARGRTQRALSP